MRTPPSKTPWALALILLLAAVLCAGCLSSSSAGGDAGGDGDSGDGDGDSGDGDGDSGDGDGDSGDGDGDSGDGDGSGGLCVTDTDCVAVADTHRACYSPGCSLPVVVSSAEAAADRCLVPWVIGAPPQVPTGCGSTPGEPVACDLSCAAPPTCIDVRCEAGRCALSFTQDGSDCTSGGGDGDCDALSAAREAALQAARECLPNGIIVECTAGESIPGECGCPIPVNDNRRDQVVAAQAAYDAWNAACEPPPRCALIDCQPASEFSGCEPGGTQGEPICVWQ